MAVYRGQNIKVIDRIDKIRLRIYLEKISGVSASNKEAYLEMCRRYEQEEQDILNAWSDLEPDQADDERNPFGDFNNWNPHPGR